MKKSLIVLVIVLLLVTGCSKKEDEGKLLDIPSEQQNDPNSEPSQAVVLGENEYISLKDNQVHKYTFTYPDEETCIKKGDGEPYDVVYPIRPYVVFGCEEVKDANGNILWGEYFYEKADENSIFYY